MKIFKKGQKVQIKAGLNAGQFNYSSMSKIGVYSVKDWYKKSFEIEGTVKLESFSHRPEIYGAYLLLHEGKKVGFVYNTGIIEIK